jgi:hypothetical protein
LATSHWLSSARLQRVGTRQALMEWGTPASPGGPERRGVPPSVAGVPNSKRMELVNDEPFAQFDPVLGAEEPGGGGRGSLLGAPARREAAFPRPTSARLDQE